jgi:hypothetical protein
MTTYFGCLPRNVPVLLVTLLSLLPYSLSFADTAAINKQIAQLDENFRQLSSAYYQSTGNTHVNKAHIINDIDQLYNEVRRLADDRHAIKAIQLIFNNANTIRDNADNEAIFSFTTLLLDANEWNMARTLLDEVSYTGDEYLIATMKFIFAKYFAARNDWQNVIEFLDGAFLDLSGEDAAYAHLLNGVALQNLRKHRLSIEHLNKVPPSSKYYSHARLNIAIANIKQGWWTDAHDTINSAIEHRQMDNSDELINRLYLVLGYSMLQQEYYRDARNTFRQIGLNSRYTNRALLGIALAATSLKDYPGGLNALSILNDKQPPDLSVDESTLLIPFIYEKLQQQLKASDGYTEALSYFRKRIDKLSRIPDQPVDFFSTRFSDGTSSLIVQDTELDYYKHYPVSFINNYRALIVFRDKSNNIAFRLKVDALISRYDDVFQQIIKNLIDERVKHLQSYLSQSRYGIARLYDSSGDGG